MKNQLTLVASLPGSGAGSMSALPAEKPIERARPVSLVGLNVAHHYGYPVLGLSGLEGCIGSSGPAAGYSKEEAEQALRVYYRVEPMAPARDADLLDTSEGGE